jgi:hypothetical protein
MSSFPSLMQRRSGSASQHGPSSVGRGLWLAVVACVNVIPSLQLFPDHPAPRALGMPGTRPSVDELVERIGAETERYGAMVVVAPTQGADDLYRDVLVARNVLGVNRLVVARVSLPPLATAVLAGQLAALAPHLLGAGQVLAALSVLSEQLIVLAGLKRVDKLEHPGLTLGLHAWSWVPWTRFLVGVQPDRFVLRLTRYASLPGVRPGGGPWLGVLSPPGTGWLQDVALPQMGVGRTVVTKTSPYASRWWGNRKPSELVVCPDSPELIVPWIQTACPCSPCPWCGEPVYGTSCPVCDMVLANPMVLPETATAGAAR